MPPSSASDLALRSLIFGTLHWPDGYCQSFYFGSQQFRGIKHRGKRPSYYTIPTRFHFKLTEVEQKKFESWILDLQTSLAFNAEEGYAG